MISLGIINICLPTVNGLSAPALVSGFGPSHITQQSKMVAASVDLWSRAVRSRHFGDYRSADPVWSILLDVYVAEANAKKSSITGVSLTTSAPKSTSLRWIKVLVEDGRLIREPDPRDRRRQWIRLSSESRAALDKYFEDLITSNRHKSYIKSLLSIETR